VRNLQTKATTIGDGLMQELTTLPLRNLPLILTLNLLSCFQLPMLEQSFKEKALQFQIQATIAIGSLISLNSPLMPITQLLEIKK
jgi:hypothetical protein